jgi:ssRNA-specific RNase YbeY (16S rRNA maturation enzyme)
MAQCVSLALELVHKARDRRLSKHQQGSQRPTRVLSLATRLQKEGTLFPHSYLSLTMPCFLTV